MSHYEQGGGEGLLVNRILLYLPRYKKSKFSSRRKRLLSGDGEKTVFVMPRGGLQAHESAFV